MKKIFDTYGKVIYCDDDCDDDCDEEDFEPDELPKKNY